MDNHPFHHSSDQGVPLASFAANPKAGLRFLLARRLAPHRLGGWAIVLRLVVAIACFAGGLLCARMFVECLRGAPEACTLDTPDVSSLLVAAIALVLIVLLSRLVLTATARTSHRVSPAQALPGFLHRAHRS